MSEIIEKSFEVLKSGVSTATEFIKENYAVIGAGTAGLAVGTAVGSIATAAIIPNTPAKKRKRKKSTRKVSRKRNYSRKRKLKFGSKAYRKRYLNRRRKKQKQPYTARKRRDTSHKRIRYTKNNQPYVIMPNGRARFISKSSVSSSRKRKGGKY